MQKEENNNKNTKLPTQPPKGTSDWGPEEFAVRKFIFDVWRKVCTRFGYEEYLTPIVESAEIYRAKSGEDIGGKELMTMTDKAGRELAIRPEMTPSVTRMVSKTYEGEAKPIRLFSIANFVRNEKPQRGRNREFWQLNFDIFGEKSINADVEIIQISTEIMLSFNPPDDAFVCYVSHRGIIDYVLNGSIGVPEDVKQNVVRVMDKFFKLERDVFEKELENLGLESVQIEKVVKFLTSETLDDLEKNFNGITDSDGFIELTEIIKTLNELGYGDYIELKTSIIRGFDYYDGMIFEVFDKHPDNNRGLFGGGRYNGLSKIYGVEDMPGVGVAPGDETTKLFLESWGLIDNLVTQTERYYLPIIDTKVLITAQKLAQKLREEGKNVIMGLSEERLGKALQYANNKGIQKVIILGEQEISKGVYLIKDMQTGEQEEETLTVDS